MWLNNGKWFQFCLTCSKFNDGTTFDNLTHLIVTQSLIEFGKMNEINVTNKLVCFGIDGKQWFKSHYDTPTYYVSLVIFQIYKNIILRNVHSLGWLL
jgi:hypothetical protein